MKIYAAQRLAAATWPTVGPHGMEGRYNTTFKGSPKTAEKFVQYLEALKAKGVNTGRRAQDYMITWDSPFVDVQDWKRKGFPVTASMVTAGRGTGQGAGALYYCPETDHFLLMLRADDGTPDGNTWCCLGGGVDDDDPSLEHTVRRESFEEAGLAMDAPMELHYVATKRYPDGFKFHNYLALVDEEFIPIINEEHQSYQWCRFQDFPANMHKGMMETFMSPVGQAALKRHTMAFQ